MNLLSKSARWLWDLFSGNWNHRPDDRVGRYAHRFMAGLVTAYIAGICLTLLFTGLEQLASGELRGLVALAFIPVFVAIWTGLFWSIRTVNRWLDRRWGVDREFTK